MQTSLTRALRSLMLLSLVAFGSTYGAQTGTEARDGASAPSRIALRAAPDYRAIVERYGPAVVGITVAGLKQDFRTQGRLPLDRGTSPSLPDNPDAPQGPVLGLGSGFIISSDGFVLTNAHVVQGAESVTVTLADRREFDAKVVGVDSDTDIAVIKIAAHNFPVVKLGNSDELHVGDDVLAIGTPYGFEETATSGIISALRRPLPDNSYVQFIQTDAAVNPGNSGGPLFDAQGEVVGINAQIYSSTGSFQGLSFAIPINLAKSIADQIIASGHVRHGYLGLTVQQLTQPLATAFYLDRPDGALVSRVKPHSAAASAGLRTGDVILKCNGTKIRGPGDMSGAVALAKPGDQMTFAVWRDGKPVRVVVTFAETASDMAAEDSASIAVIERLGVDVKLLSEDERSEANVSRGMIILRAFGSAQKVGIMPGDILLSVNGTPVTDVERLRSDVADGPSTVALLIQRNDARTYIAVRTTMDSAE